MKKAIIAILLVAACPGIIAAATPLDAYKPLVSGRLMLGYDSGPGVQPSLMISRLAAGFPVGLRLGIGFATVEPGKPAEARQVFINDATNGIPEENGRLRVYRFDFLYPLQRSSPNSAGLFVGPRYAKFSGNFKYVGGNEDFSITSKQWGLGAGIEKGFRIGGGMGLVVTTGVDHFFTSRLYGHDTTYDPDGEDVNPRDGFDFADADSAIDQPKTEYRLMFGVNYAF